MKYHLSAFFCLMLMSQQCKGPEQKETAAEESSSCIDSSKINKDAACVMIYQPVCGCDGIIYSNDCVALNQGLLTWTEGGCDNPKESLDS